MRELVPADITGASLNAARYLGSLGGPATISRLIPNGLQVSTMEDRQTGGLVFFPKLAVWLAMLKAKNAPVMPMDIGWCSNRGWGDGVHFLDWEKPLSKFDPLAEEFIAVNKYGCVTALRSGKFFALPNINYDFGDGLVEERKDLDKVKQFLEAATKVNLTDRKKPKPLDQSKIIVGSDIEFTLVDSDGLVHSPVEFFDDTQDGRIGTDGNVETLEIRVKEDPDTNVVVDNLGILLENINAILPDGFDLWGGGGGDIRRCTGLHIHFSGTSADVSRSNGEQAVRRIVSWLDALIAKPLMSMMPGAARATNEYGRFGDYRNQNNHGGFPHRGFEWRVLPTCIPNKRFARALFAIAKAIVVTHDSGVKIAYDNEDFSPKWYKGLVGYDGIVDEVELFCSTVTSRQPLSVGVLNGWFGRSTPKDRECDVEVVFGLGDHIAIRSFVMHDPQKRFDRIVVLEIDGDYVRISEDVRSIRKHILRTAGKPCTIKGPTEATKKKYTKGRTLFIGFPSDYLNDLNENSRGSRNRVKMMVQEMVKNI